MSRFLKSAFTFDGIWKVLTTLGLAAVLYLNGHYVTVQRFEASHIANTTEHQRITEVLAQINTSISLLQQNQKVIEDLRITIPAIKPRPLREWMNGGKI